MKNSAIFKISMIFTLEKTSRDKVNYLMRKAGYHCLGQDIERLDLSFVRPLGRAGYPRFHIYLKTNPQTQKIIFNLHLDQKRPIYQGSTAHSGEYNGPIVEQEAERIKQLLK